MSVPNLDLFVRSIGIPLIVSAVLAYPIYRLLLALKSRQTVSRYVQEHAHKQGTPTMGGIITGIGFLAGCLALDPIEKGSIGHRPEIAIPLLFVGYALIGLLDDFVIPRVMKEKRGLGWTQKLAMQIVVATVCALMVAGGVGKLEIVLTVFLVLFFSNAYNFADGLDWLAGLLLPAMLAGYVPIAIAGKVEALIPYLLALFAASLPFLVLNKPKAKLFMGDVGALPIGAVLGLFVSMIAFPNMAPAYDPRSEHVSNAAIGLALFLVSGMMIAELVPVPLQILSVKLRHGKRLFLMTPIHHAYQKRGWKETRVVLAFVLVQVALSTLGAAYALNNPVPARGEGEIVGQVR